MIDDLVKRLRTSADIDDVHEAADLIETQADRIEKLEAALIEINEINAKRSGYNKKIENIIYAALEEES